MIIINTKKKRPFLFNLNTHKSIRHMRKKHTYFQVGDFQVKIETSIRQRLKDSTRCAGNHSPHILVANVSFHRVRLSCTRRSI